MVNVYFADFETTTSPKNPEVRSFQIAGDFSNVPTKEGKWHKTTREGITIMYGVKLGDFIELILTIPKTPIIYFNNLYNFDGHFIYPYLVNKLKWAQIHDFKQIQLRHKNRIKNIANIYRTHWKTKSEFNTIIKKVWGFVFAKEFSALIDGNYGIYEIKLGKTKEPVWVGHKNYYISIRCFYRLFVSSVSHMGMTLNRTYGVDRYGKLQLSKENHYSTWDKPFKDIYELEKSGEVFEYSIHDVVIMIKFYELLMSNKNFTRSSLKLTAASTAFNEWLKTFGKTHHERFGFRKIKVKNKDFYKYHHKDLKWPLIEPQLGKNIYNKVFPTKWLKKEHQIYETHDTHLRRWYSGGITAVNEDYRGTLVPNCTHLDINSSYPNVMYSHTKVPYGEPSFFNDPKKPFKFYSIKIMNTITNTHHLPFITPFSTITNKRKKVNPKYSPTKEYPRTLTAGDTIYLNSLNLEYFKEHYNVKDIDIKIKVEYSFYHTPIMNAFKKHINKWYSIKRASKIKGDFGLLTLAKLMLNSVYGKFGSQINKETKYLIKDDEWGSYESEGATHYLPLAIAITDLARLELVKAIGNRYNQFVYCDTDSLIIKDYVNKDFPNLEVETEHNTGELGLWALETVSFKGKTINLQGHTVLPRRAKQYIWYYKNDINTPIKAVFASLHIKREIWDKLTPNTFITGYHKGKQLRVPMLRKARMKNGIYLDDTFTKQITPAWDYPVLKEQKVVTEREYKALISNRP